MTNLEVARSYWAAEHDHDLEKILSHFAEDAEFTSPTMVLTGRGEIRRYYENVLANFGSVEVTVENHLEQGEQLAVEWKAVLGGDDGERTVLGCNIFTIRSDRIARMRVYFNAADFE